MTQLSALIPTSLIKNDMERFIWDKHGYSVEYLEHFRLIENGAGQGVIPKLESCPLRKFSLKFEGMYNGEKARIADKSSCFKSLEKFYLKHGMFKIFIYYHPIYGDVLVRFSKPLSMPKNKANSIGFTESFDLEFTEVQSKPFVFHKSEKLLENELMDFPFIYHSVGMDYPDDISRVILSGNNIAVFQDFQTKLRTFKLDFPLMLYMQHKGEVSFIHNRCANLLSLELFYVQHRLDRKFIYIFNGERVLVKFKNPLKTNPVTGDSGAVLDISLELVETPYDEMSSIFSGPIIDVGLS
jgi:hypothetical protein